MTSYAFWNNKGGVGKSFLCFIAATEYAHRHPETDVYVIDLCPQANVSEMLLGGYPGSINPMKMLLHTSPRSTVAGYLEARLNSPFRMIDDISPFISHPKESNSNIPENLKLVCGDNLLEIISEAIRQTSQLSIPVDSWKKVLNWIRDLTVALRESSGNRDAVFIVDCNPSFSVYTQLALVSADYVIVPFTADDSSRRAIENVVALLYGIADEKIDAYARITFAKRAKDDGLTIPRLHTFISNRVTLYEGKASKAFEAASKNIKNTVDKIHEAHRQIYANPKNIPSQGFLQIPDYHGACVVSAMTGTPLHKLKAGPRIISGERVQLNPDPLDRYKKSLTEFVNCL